MLMDIYYSATRFKNDLLGLYNIDDVWFSKMTLVKLGDKFVPFCEQIESGNKPICKFDDMVLIAQLESSEMQYKRMDFNEIVEYLNIDLDFVHLSENLTIEEIIVCEAISELESEVDVNDLRKMISEKKVGNTGLLKAVQTLAMKGLINLNWENKGLKITKMSVSKL